MSHLETKGNAMTEQRWFVVVGEVWSGNPRKTRQQAWRSFNSVGLVHYPEYVDQITAGTVESARLVERPTRGECYLARLKGVSA